MPSSMGWPWLIHEPSAGAWQMGSSTTKQPESLMRSSAVFACVTGIAADVAKLGLKVSRDDGGIWKEVRNSEYLPLLARPNHFQNRMQFLKSWLTSKLLTGNSYILLQRDSRGEVVAMHVLDPLRTWPLVADSGSVYYQLRTDALSGIESDTVVVPASEIIHDRADCLWHPLVGVPPLYACAASGSLANQINSASGKFFGNRAMPGGILTAPGAISDATAARLKADFETKFSGENSGKIAVVGDGLKFEAMAMTAEASQLVEQMKMSVEDVARAFHYPLSKLGILPTTAASVESTTMMYYTDCLQQYIEAVELGLDDGLGLTGGLHIELDLDGLIRMDTAAMFDANNKAVGGGWMSPNEARYKANLPPVDGGDTPYLQQQNYSLAALDERDRNDPFGGQVPPEPEPTEDADKMLMDAVRKNAEVIFA